MAGIYIHIPFCKRRCIYCDFYSTTQEEKREEYVHTVCKELEMRRHYLGDAPVETIYLGGGTPSRLGATDFQQLFDCMERLFDTRRCKEITLEANPDDLTAEYIQTLRRFPFNRISIGIQTFHEPTLQFLGRRHSARQAIEAVRACQRAGFHNISIDLIYGLPHETDALWAADLQQAIALHVPHISAYSLIYEEGTALWQLRERHQVAEAEEEASLAYFTQLMNRLHDAGFLHYEISNFCLPGYQSLHNSSYWNGTPYLGCGPSAHSYNGTSRQWNVASLREYLEAIHGGTIPCETETLTRYTRYNERIITSIRTCYGLSLAKLQREFGQALYDYCLRNARPHLSSGALEIKEDALRLTRKGIFVSDGIMSDLLWVED